MLSKVRPYHGVKALTFPVCDRSSHLRGHVCLSETVCGPSTLPLSPVLDARVERVTELRAVAHVCTSQALEYGKGPSAVLRHLI